MGNNKGMVEAHHDSNVQSTFQTKTSSCNSSSWYPSDPLARMMESASSIHLDSGSSSSHTDSVIANFNDESVATPNHATVSCNIPSVTNKHQTLGTSQTDECNKSPKAHVKKNRLFESSRKSTLTQKEVFMCPEIHCGKQFPRSFALRRHMRIHTGIKPYRCDYEGCTQCFNTSGNLSRHKRIHSGERPYPCIVPSCEKRFNTSTKLKRHMRSHFPEGEHLFRCIGMDCTWSSDNYKEYVQHQKIQHNIAAKYRTGDIMSDQQNYMGLNRYNSSMAAPLEQNVYPQPCLSRSYASSSSTNAYRATEYVDCESQRPRQLYHRVSPHPHAAPDEFSVAAANDTDRHYKQEHDILTEQGGMMSTYHHESQRKGHIQEQKYESRRPKYHNVRSPSLSNPIPASEFPLASHDTYQLEHHPTPSTEPSEQTSFYVSRSGGYESSISYNSGTDYNNGPSSASLHQIGRLRHDLNYTNAPFSMTSVIQNQRAPILGSIQHAPLLRPPPRSPMEENTVKREHHQRFQQQPYNSYPVPPMQPAAPEFTGEELSVVLELMK